MGLDYSYLLYFHRKDLWNALKGVSEIAGPHHPPTLIIFPESILPLPLQPSGTRQKIFHYDDREFSFACSMRFPVDEAIFEYLLRGDQTSGLIDPAKTKAAQFTLIGYIYLTVYNDLTILHPESPRTDWVLFNFGTPGTHMSLLFSESSAIKQTFTNLLYKYHGICGVFNREDEGTVFWFQDQEMDVAIDDPWLLPSEIERALIK